MKAKGYLSQYFDGAAVRRLTPVEIDGAISTQHEFQGDDELRKLFGTEKTRFPARFLYLADDGTDVLNDGTLTWYDARAKKPNRSPEYRLYYSAQNAAVAEAECGDTLLIARLRSGTVLALIMEAGSTIEAQTLWLFGLEATSDLFTIRTIDGTDSRIDYTSRFILEALGIEVEDVSDDYLEPMLRKWRGKFPKTKDFSAFARETYGNADLDSPDKQLMEWMEREEILFRQLEHYQLSDRITGGFADVEEFIAFSLSIQNRRKSRVGHALENHLEYLFNALGLKFGRNRTAVTENNKKPDFLFPGKVEYDDLRTDPVLLTMLGAKSTCKDRWRQVTTEANRIVTKHLLTLEAAISSNQTDEMRSHNVQLVVPGPVQKSYLPAQRDWLIGLSDFISLVRERQIRFGGLSGTEFFLSE